MYASQTILIVIENHKLYKFYIIFFFISCKRKKILIKWVYVTFTIFTALKNSLKSTSSHPFDFYSFVLAMKFMKFVNTCVTNLN